MGGMYAVDLTAEFIEILVHDTEKDWVPFGKQEFAVPAPWPQRWPTRPAHGQLLHTIHKYNAHCEFKYESGSRPTAEVSVNDMDLIYEVDDDGVHYILRGVVPHGTKIPPKPIVQDHSRLANELISAMPGLNERVSSPCTCPRKEGAKSAVQSVIMHLNDNHHPTKGTHRTDPWSRERIAQWTETLPFDLTLDPDRPKPASKMIMTTTSPWQTSAAKESLKDMMQSMTVSQDELIKAIGYVGEASAKLADTIKHTFEVTFKDVNPEAIKMLTGMSVSGDNDNEEEV